MIKYQQQQQQQHQNNQLWIDRSEEGVPPVRTTAQTKRTATNNVILARDMFIGGDASGNEIHVEAGQADDKEETKTAHHTTYEPERR